MGIHDETLEHCPDLLDLEQMSEPYYGVGDYPDDEDLDDIRPY